MSRAPGFTHPPETRAKMAEAQRGKRHSAETKARLSAITSEAIQGENNPRWAGDDITYAGAHSRVRQHRGQASEQECVECGKQARHWSYEGEGTHSGDVTQYVPRCVPCHSRIDRRRRCA